MTIKKTISQILSEKTFKELGIDPKTGKLTSPNPSYLSLKSNLGNSRRDRGDIWSNLPFRSKALEKTKRQSYRGLAYRYSAVYRNAYILRLLGKKFTLSLNQRKYVRLISQIDSELRSVVANIREGYLRPSSAEFSIFLGYSQASLEEFRGDITDALDDGLLKSQPGSSLGSLNLSLKPPPDISPKRQLENLRRIIGEIKSSDLTYEIFLEIVNKTSWLLKRAVQGIDRKIIYDEKKILSQELTSHWHKVW